MRNLLIRGYVLLVGFPVLLLLGALQIGRGLSAPKSVRGEWQMTAEAELNSCTHQILGVQQTTFRITQSGANISLLLADSGLVLEGELIRDQMNATGVAKLSGCGLATPAIQARISGSRYRRSLEGSLTFAGCPGCQAVPIRAVRKEARESAE